MKVQGMYIAVPDSLGGMGGLKVTDVRRERTPFRSVQDLKSARKCPYALHPVSDKFLQRRL